MVAPRIWSRQHKQSLEAGLLKDTDGIGTICGKERDGQEQYSISKSDSLIRNVYTLYLQSHDITYTLVRECIGPQVLT
jgi:hypothetical protein